jgi:hypothetical protein
MKKKITLFFLCIGIIIGLTVGLFFKHLFPMETTSVNILNISFEPGKTIAESYWVADIVLHDLPITNLFLMTDSMVGGKYLFDGKLVHIKSVLNITFAPSERPYVLIPYERNSITVTMKTYDALVAYDESGVFAWCEPNYTSYVNPMTVEYLIYEGDVGFVYTPFRIIVQKDSQLILNSTYATEYNTSTSLSNQKYVIPLGYENQVGYINIYGQEAYRESLINAKIISQGETVYFKDGYWFENEFIEPETAIKYSLINILSNLNHKYSYNNYWFGSYRWSSYSDGVRPEANGTPRPEYYWEGHIIDSYNLQYVKNIPGWTSTLSIVDSCLYAKAISPSFESDVLNDNGQYAYSLLNYISKDLRVKPVQIGNYPYTTQGNYIKIYNLDFKGGHEVLLKIPASLVDTYVEVTPVGKLSLINAYWTSTNTLNTTIQPYTTDTLNVYIFNNSTDSASCSFDLTFNPSTITNYVSISGDVQGTLNPGETKLFKINVKALGPPIKIEGIWLLNAKDRNGNIFGSKSGTISLSMLGGELYIWTEGEEPPNSATIYVDGQKVIRNYGVKYKCSLTPGSHVISFENYLPEKYRPAVVYLQVDTSFNKIGDGFAIVNIESGKSYNVKGVYEPASYVAHTFKGWTSYGFIGIGTFGVPVNLPYRTNVNEYDKVSLSIGLTSTETKTSTVKIEIIKNVDNTKVEVYTFKEEQTSFVIGIEKMVSLDFTIDGGISYFYRVYVDDKCVYAGSGVDRPELFVTPFCIAYGLHIGIGITIIVALGLALYYLKWKALTGVRY